MNFNVTPYYDDAQNHENWLSVLFNPGRSVQARELTQIQSLVQKQISRLGNHIFKNGSVVTGGTTTLNTDAICLNVDPNTISSAELLNGLIVQSIDGSVKAKVIQIDRKTESEKYKLIVTYITSGSFSPGQTLTTFDDSYTFSLTSVPITNAAIFSVNSGVFYINGYFVYTDNQTIALSYENNTPSYRVGFNVSDLIITESDDSSLYDPASGTTNYNAPGAHRYSIVIELGVRDLSTQNSNDINFIELTKIESGQIQSKIEYPEYSDLAKTFARRTFDESGNYTVRPFEIGFKNHATDTNKFIVEVDSGKAYVNGFEFETISKEFLDVDKAIDTDTNNNQIVPTYYGAYIEAATAIGAVAPNDLLTLKTNADVIVGYAQCKCIRNDSGKIRIYIYGLRSSLTDIQQPLLNFVFDKITCPSGAVISNLTKNSGNVVINEPNDITLIWDTNSSWTVRGGLTDVSVELTKQYFGVSTDGTNTITLYTANSNERFFGQGTYSGGGYSAISQYYTFLDSTTGAIITPTTVNIPSVGSSEIGRILVTFSSARTLNCHATIVTNSPQIRTKTQTTKLVVGAGNATRIDLDASDVISVTVIGNTTGINRTADFTLVKNATDSVYWQSYLTKNVSTTYAETLNITVTYYSHSGIGALTVDSYADYDSIPTHVNASGKTLQLRDCFDFRPVWTTGNLISGNTTPTQNGKINFDTQFYVSRKDKIIINKDLKFSIVKGIPALNPVSPAAASDSMVLWNLEIPPYTNDLSKIIVGFVENKRYTMRDIGKLETRISNLEYYTTLSLTESNVAQKQIFDIDGVPRYKNGILVDGFTGHSIGDVYKPTYICSIDSENRELRPAFELSNAEVQYSQTNSNNIIVSADGISTIDYTPQVYIDQPIASSTVAINPYNVLSWTGIVSMNPQNDTWFDLNRLPDVITNVQGQAEVIENSTNNLGLGSIFNIWGTSWTGQTTTSTTTSTTERITTTVDDVEISRNIIPYIRQRDIAISIKGVRPNTQFWAFFDEQPATQYLPGGAAVQSDGAGEITTTLSIPGGIFRTGNRIVRFIDNSTNDVSTSISSAEGIYTAMGVIINRQQQIINTRTPIITRTTVTTAVPSQTPTPTPTPTPTTSARQFLNRLTLSNIAVDKGGDPLAQTFFVDELVYPNGLFLESIDIYFEKKDPFLPVKLQIRPTVNGYPHSSIIYPLSEVTLYPNEVITNNISSSQGVSVNSTISVGTLNKLIPTKFKFSSPIYLQAGEHSFVLLSNSDIYKVYFAQFGADILNSTPRKIIDKQPYVGSMFKSQNSSTWTAEQDSDIMFRINRCKFNVNTQASLTHDFIPPADAISYDIIDLTSAPIKFDSVSELQFDITTTDGTTSTTSTINENTNITLTSRNTFSTIGDNRLTYRLITNSDHVSPVIDLQRTSLIMIKNIINNDSTDETLANDGNALARYMTRKVTLAPGFIGGTIKLYIDDFEYAESSIKIFAKTGYESDIFETKPWVEMTKVVTTKPNSNNKFSENEYNIDVAAGFNIWAIKIVMLTSDTTKVPTCKNLRIVTLEK